MWSNGVEKGVRRVKMVCTSWVVWLLLECWIQMSVCAGVMAEETKPELEGLVDNMAAGLARL